MLESFSIKFEFMEKWGRFAKPEYLQIYLYALSVNKKEGKTLTKEALAKKLDKKLSTVEAAIDYWVNANVLDYLGDEYVFIEENEKMPSKKTKTSTAKDKLRVRPSYNSAEIDAVISINGEIDYLFKEAERILGRLLSPSDLELLFSFVDWLGLPVEVVIMLLRFVKSKGKTGKRYIETVAIDWADRGIDTYESAEEHIKQIEEKLSNEGKVRGVLGIYDRALTQTEKKYITSWTHEKNFALELIEEAYDKTVTATGKLSWAYMNKILLSWEADGFKTISDVRENESSHKAKAPALSAKTKRKSKFVNYNDTNRPDYSNFAEELLKDMLEE